MFFPVDMFEKTLSQWQTRYIKLMELIETEYKNRTLPLQTLDCSEVSLSEGIEHKLFWKSTKSQLDYWKKQLLQSTESIQFEILFSVP